MEAIGAIASTLQIAGQCAQCTMTIVQWYRSVKTVDERVESFKHEIYTLQRTYETLRATFDDQSKLAIANATNKDAGGRLARQLESTLREGERIVVATNNELRRIHSTSNTVFRPIIKQVKESLSQGDLARYRERIVLVNHELHLVLQMMAVSMSLQQDASASNQAMLEKEILDLRQSVEQLTRALAAPRRTFSFGETVVEDTADDKGTLEDKATSEYIESANKFIESASAAATARSVASTIHPDQDQYNLPALRRGSAWAPLSDYKLSVIGSYVENLPPDAPETPMASDAQSSVGEVHATTPSFSDDDVEVAIVNSLLSEGQSAIDAGQYSLAEENFREAHSKLTSTDFGSHIIATMSDITLSLAYCCIKQEKYDGAVELLQPLYEAYGGQEQSSKIADQGEALSACHMLGEVYLKKSDFANAEQYSTRAFKERKNLLGLQHVKTQESVLLVIQMYEGSGRGALAKAYRNFQRTPHELHAPSSPITNTISRSSTDQSGSAVEPNTHRTRRPTFNLRFRRSDKEEIGTKVGPSSSSHTIPLKSPALGDTLNELSISPRELLSPSPIIQQAPPVRHIRQDSTVSHTSQAGHRVSFNSIDASNDPTFAAATSSLERKFTTASDSSQVAAEANITAIRDLCKKGSKHDAVKASISFMRNYDPDKAILIQREDELKRNIEKSKGKGLAGTGYGYAPIHFFCSQKHEAASEVEMLVKHGADVNAVAYKAGLPGVGAFTPLSRSVELGHSSIVQLLLDKGAYIMPAEIRASRDGRHPLHVACKRGHVDIVMSLLRHGVVFSEEDFRNQQWHGNSLLHEAGWRCDLAMVKCLMDYHDQASRKGSTAYSFIGHPGQQDAFGMTPVMYTVDMRDALDARLRAHKEQSRIDCLRLLLGPSDGYQDRPRSQYGPADEIVVERSASMENRTRRMTVDLHTEDEKGHSVFWYAAEERDGDANLRAFLDEYSRQSVLIELD